MRAVNRLTKFAGSLLVLSVVALGIASHAAGAAFTNSSLEGLTDTSGSVLPRNAFPGKYRIVLFGFTSCADVCPLTLLAIKQSLQLLGDRATHVAPVFISVDPQRDSGDVLRRYVRAFDERIKGLSGPQDVVERVAKAHGIFVEKRWLNVAANSYVFDHTASVLVVAPDGRLIASVSTTGPTNQVAHNIVAALPAQLRPGE